ncbi:MAG: hypothetical protein GC203_20775 [Phenylobacterium sp.]|uniref:hypothetical protein n=1 Tax=Phenylobacterium sp. TaxID=1871053 RepID=UPI0025EB37B4|nr:hypothetical protein [Phenylobacterium sp.]MBI1200301.1 hypothetical protein [Phenylobacterium sp.]
MELAAAAVAVVAPYLVEAGKGAAKTVGGEVAKPVLEWMRAKLGGRAKAALADLEAHPDVEVNRDDLRVQLVKALAADPSLKEELGALLPTGATQAVQMTQNVQGPGAAGAQVFGSNNQTTVRGGRAD